MIPSSLGLHRSAEPMLLSKSTMNRVGTVAQTAQSAVSQVANLLAVRRTRSLNSGPTLRRLAVGETADRAVCVTKSGDAQRRSAGCLACRFAGYQPASV